MLRKALAGLAVAAFVTTAAVAFRDDGPGPVPRKDAPPKADPVLEPIALAPLKPTQKLPVTEVVLFNSGVGYFSRKAKSKGTPASISVPGQPTSTT